MRDWEGVLTYWRDRHRIKRGQWQAVGRGSTGRLAQYKSGLVSALVARVAGESVVDLGCGDGRQAEGFVVDRYDGLDISSDAVEEARERFAGLEDWNASTWDPAGPVPVVGCVAVSLDVVFHQVDQALFAAYMHSLFGAARKAVGIYSTNFDREPAGHIRHHCVTRWAEDHRPEWTLTSAVPPRWPNKTNAEEGSDCWWHVWEPAS